MSDLEKLIVSTELEIKEATERLALLKGLKKKEDNSTYISTEEAAEMLGVKRQTIITWVMEGRLTGRKVGRKWQILLASAKEGGKKD